MNDVLNLRPLARSLRTGDAVFCPDGKMGVLADVQVFGMSSVTLSPPGVGYYDWKELRLMTPDEVAEHDLTHLVSNQKEAAALIVRRRRDRERKRALR